MRVCVCWCAGHVRQVVSVLNLTCHPKKWAKRYRLMVSAYQTCIPTGCMMTPTTRDMTVRETYTQCVVLSNKVCLVCLCHKVDELNSKQNKPTWSSRLSMSFRGNFLVICPLQHAWDSILKKIFSQKSFSNKGMTLRNPKKNLRKDIWVNWVGTLDFPRRDQGAPHPCNLHWVPEMGWWTEWFGRYNHGYVSTWDKLVLWCRG